MHIKFISFCLLLCVAFVAHAQNHDHPSVVEQWSDASTYTKVIDINFSDEVWPDTWAGQTAASCPETADGGYINKVIETATSTDGVTFPVLFHNCTFATKRSYKGKAATTSAFAKLYYNGANASGNATYGYNNWKSTGHTKYIEDNIVYNESGVPVYGEAGFVQFNRNNDKSSTLGWMEIDHIPYVERVQWAWSNGSWGRGIMCDYKVGDGEWQPLAWMGENKHKQGYSVFAEQGYFMENVINKSDVSIRWRIWNANFDSNGAAAEVLNANCNDGTGTNWSNGGWAQASRVHKIRIFGNSITATDAENARKNLSDVGEETDISAYVKAAPDENAAVQLFVVDPLAAPGLNNGVYTVTSVQAAIDATESGKRGIIFIRDGVYNENIYAGTKDNHDKFISFIGESQNGVLLKSDVRRASSGTPTFNDCAALNVYVQRFYAENLTVENTQTESQAEALYTNGDGHIFNNVVLKGYQDTYKANTASRGYFKNCTIVGATDFIYDSGLEWFEGCTIHSVAGKYITAPGEAFLTLTKALHGVSSADAIHVGLCFNNCVVSAESGLSNVNLGRSWGANAGCLFMNSKLGSHISAAGWADMGGNLSSASFAEYNNMNADGSARSACSGSLSLSKSDVDNFFTPNKIFDLANEKSPFDPESILSSALAPENVFYSMKSFSWDSNDDVAAYIVLRNGAFYSLQTSNAFSPTDDASYSVKAVSKRGVSSEAVALSVPVRQLAFPSAEGFGKFASGGRGGRVVTVSTREDNVEGSLRWAFSQYPDEPITIVFSVGGQFVLKSEMRVNRKDWTLAGQTAPAPVVITRQKVNFGGSENFIVRSVAFRVGDYDVNNKFMTQNACATENCNNYIFDHCAFGWSTEENMNTADSHFLTIQYSIVHEGLYSSDHPKGSRGYGCQWGGSPATYHHNLLANNYNRSIRFNGARGNDDVVMIEYINNVNYNFGKQASCYGGENTANISSFNGLNSAHECNFINNYYKPGAGSASNPKFLQIEKARSGATSWGPSKWFISGNVMEGYASSTSDNWSAVKLAGSNDYALADHKVDSRITPALQYYRYATSRSLGLYDFDAYKLENIESASNAFNSVVAQAGTIVPDAVQIRILNEAKNGTYTYSGSKGKLKGIIDLPSDAEGFDNIVNKDDAEADLDSDADGMPDAWETANGLNKNDASDRNNISADGYTALEVYLNSLMSRDPSALTPSVTGFGSLSVSSVDVAWSTESNSLLVSPEAVGARVEVYSLSGALVMSSAVKNVANHLSLPRGVYFIKVSGDSITPRVIKAQVSK